MRSFLIETWGCQMNVHDSEKLAGILAKQGYSQTGAPETADVILLNTCSVREKAADKVFSRLGELRRYKHDNPDLIIGVCGCVAQAEGESIFRRAPHVDLIMGPRNIAQLGPLLEQARRDGRSINLARDDDPILFPSETTARATGPRAYVTVMEGCNKSCTFCIVPYTRGREVYRPSSEIMAEVRDLAAQGFCEIELLGQNVNAYHNAHPGHLKRPIMDAMRDVPTVCNHLHLPIQSGSDRILRAMNRGYTHRRYLERITDLRARVPDISFSTDIIVGFPGETNADFRETLSTLTEVGFDQVYAFTYSPRPGTPASTMETNLQDDLKSARLQELHTLQSAIQRRRNAELVGRTFEILIDGHSRMNSAALKGRTTCNRIVNVGRPPAPPERFLTVRITKAHAHSLSGEPLAAHSSA
jgi:tRNA-2-methylthio-N6-dimethylallyladenosine synthase